MRGDIGPVAAYGMPATIDDPTVLGEIGEGLKGAGYPRRG